MIIIQIRRSRLFKVFTVGVCLCVIQSLVIPTAALALTSGPTSPEFTAFEPVATTDMVNVFSGDFLYNLPLINIPGPHGSGYALSLSYHSGNSIETEASWVGYGWTLNPGAINRSTRGFPDDFNGSEITHFNKTDPNWTASVTYNADLEAYSNNPLKALGFTFNKSVSYNNHVELSKSVGIGFSFMSGTGTVGLNFKGGEVTLNGQINPFAVMQKKKKLRDDAAKEQVRKYKEEGDGEKLSLAVRAKKATGKDLKKTNNRTSWANGLVGTYGMMSYEESTRPTNIHKFFGYNITTTNDISLKYENVGLGFGIAGNFAYQRSKELETTQAFGYLYNDVKTGNNQRDNELYDYFIEKESNFNKRDLFVGIPFNNSDVFSVTGEGVNGGFRAYHNKVGHYYPKHVATNIKNFEFGIEFNLPIGMGSLGIGPKLGGGVSRSSIAKLPDAEYVDDDYQFDIAQLPFFKFMNDLGGTVEYGQGGAAISDATLSPKPSILGGGIGYEVNMPTNLTNGQPGIYLKQLMGTNNRPVGSSSYIEYHTNDDIFNNNQRFDNKHTAPIYPAAQGTNNTVAEYKMTDPSGQEYIYGLPMFSKNEYSVSFGVASNAVLKNNNLVYQDINDEVVSTGLSSTVVGEYQPDAYASTYLLTQINTPDYVDLLQDGPTDDDLGGWTKFSYTKLYGGNGTWYKWRMPYTGYSYIKGDIGKADDDMANFSSGVREVSYLKTIETKTHIAYFVTNKSNPSDFGTIPANLQPYLTGSQGTRHDSYSAASYGQSTNGKPGLNEDAIGNQELRYLEKVVLVAKARPDVPLKVAYFEYDFHLGKYLANSSQSKAGGNPANSGKLTLRKVWFEYEGTYKARISPYIFNYSYKKASEFPSHIIDKNGFLTGDWPNYSAAAENPDYSPFVTDCWGNYRYASNNNVNHPANGVKRLKNQNPWVYQGENHSEFDPAAWHLKQIILPSGGEILVQYEQDDYAYVQDRKAMAMVNLIPHADESNSYGRQNKYFIDLGNLEVDPAAQLQLMQKHFADKNNRIYYKFLYSLAGGNPHLDDCGSEYIDGYAVVDEIGMTGNKIWIRLGSKGADEKYDVPRQACFQYIINERSVSYNNCTNAWSQLDLDIMNNAAGSYQNESDYSDRSNARNFWSVAKSAMSILDDLRGSPLADPLPILVCNSLNHELSYFKVPIAQDKKGGGVRVKRLLMYSKGLESGNKDAQLLGTEYIYKTEDGQSSGIATNEPSAAREENALVGFLPRMGQSFFNRIVFGRDKKQVEGPIGESLLPGASVGYSRIVIKGIHDDVKTGMGYAIHEYFTAKDYPFDKFYGATDGTGDNEINGGGVAYSDITDRDHKRRNYLMLPTPFVSVSINDMYVSQGFRFILNNMHGQMKSVRTYSGVYGLGASSNPVTSTEYTYYEPGEKLRSISYDPSASTNPYTIEDFFPGKETDICMDSRWVNDFNFGIGFELDINVELVVTPHPSVSFGGLMVNFNKSSLGSHTISKVISYPAIVKSTTSMVDRVVSKTENVLFDKVTGLPLVTKTYDGYNGLVLEQPQLHQTTSGNMHEGYYYSLNLPAHWYNAAMGQKSFDAGFSNQLTASAGSIVTYGKDADGNTLENESWYDGSKGNVISASYQSYSASWDPLDDYGGHAPKNTIYKPSENYVYKPVPISESNIWAANTTSRTYTGGAMSSFDLYTPASPNWQQTVKITNYTPHGEPVEEVNPLNIYSCVKYGYGSQKDLPSVMAQNARYYSIGFEDFENNGLATVSGHSGKKAFNLPAGASATLFTDIDINTQVIQKGARVLFWAKGPANFTSNDIQLRLSPALPSTITSNVIAQVGEWRLVEYIVKFSSTTSPTRVDVEFVNAYTSAQGVNIHLDDLRIQPLDAQLKCFVYDPDTYRLLAEFGDSHFGIYYQYDQEGRLLRKLIETELGIKTLQENYINIPAINR